MDSIATWIIVPILTIWVLLSVHAVTQGNMPALMAMGASAELMWSWTVDVVTNWENSFGNWWSGLVSW